MVSINQIRELKFIAQIYIYTRSHLMHEKAC